MKGFMLFLGFVSALVGQKLFAKHSIFINESISVPQSVPVFWAGSEVDFQFYAPFELTEPKVFVLSDSFAAPIDLATHEFKVSQTEDGMYLHSFHMSCPEPKSIQSYALRFKESKRPIVIQVYPFWIQEQVRRKSDRFNIVLRAENEPLNPFFDFEPKDGQTQAKTRLEITHHESEMLIKISENEAVWRVNLETFNPRNPKELLRFESVLDSLNEFK